MKQILVATLLSVLLAGAYYQSQTENQNDFQRWSQQYGKVFSDEERLYRETVYNQNKRMIEDHNNDLTHTYTMGENQFMTLTREEFIELYLNQIETPEQPVYPYEIVSDEILQAVDWRNATTVKSQGNCAAGWAFSVSNNVEAWYKIRAGQNISVSTQQLVDCDQYSSGCTGGVNYYAMYYIQNYRVANSSQYPYVAYKQTCKTTAGTWGINNYTFVGGQQSTLQSYLQNYPVSVGVDATNWQFYSSGLFSNCSSNVTNHYALAVGFDYYNNWIVQNSFGSGWGEAGHIRLYSNNTCGILNQAYQVY